MTENQEEFYKAYKAQRKFTGDTVLYVYELPNKEAIIEVYNNRDRQTYFSRAYKDASKRIICCSSVYHNFYECMEKEIIFQHKKIEYN